MCGVHSEKEPTHRQEDPVWLEEKNMKCQVRVNSALDLAKVDLQHSPFSLWTGVQRHVTIKEGAEVRFKLIWCEWANGIDSDSMLPSL